MKVSAQPMHKTILAAFSYRERWQMLTPASRQCQSYVNQKLQTDGFWPCKMCSLEDGVDYY